jgi:hypothetical protein
MGGGATITILARGRFTTSSRSQIATTTKVETIVPHIIGVTCSELPLRGKSLAARLNSRFMWTLSKQSRRCVGRCPVAAYRNAARTLSQSDVPSSWRSCFDGDGCTALTGSDAGKLSIKPASNLAWASRSAAAAARGSAACLSCAAGSNFLAILNLHGGITPAQSGRSRRLELKAAQSDCHRRQCTGTGTRPQQDFFAV